MLKDFTKETFDIIIQAGQSNAQGSGIGPAAAPYQPKDTVYAMRQDRTIGVAAEIVDGNRIRGNFALSFADSYINAGLLADGRKLLILYTAVGGTGFADEKWRPQDPLFLQMLDMARTALRLNPANRIVCLLWHQGETDAIFNVAYDTYYRHFDTLLRLTRGEFGEIPFIAGDFVQQWKAEYGAPCDPVVNALRAVCKENALCAFVETQGLKSNKQELEAETPGIEDTIHFSRQSLYELGRRYFEAYRQITEA